MFAKRNVLTHLIFLIVQESAIGEWIELPQFSDDAKVYRIPSFTKYDRKHILNSQDGPKIYEYGNTSVSDENYRRPLKQQLRPDETTETTPPGTVTTIKNVYVLDKGEILVAQNPQSNEDRFDQDAVVEDEEEIVTVPTTYSDDKIIVSEDQPYQAVSENPEKETPIPEVENTDEKPSFLAFIPIELFKKVHAILKSQSTTAEGKIDFLRRFESTLLAEIEKRLVPVINPVRKKRESRGHHGWDEHDSSVGFPSLEGALMAIAFLTFAVYLVQLVMMLFRNLGNNGTQQGTATILFNRTKRSADELTEETARILEYLDKFAKNSRNL